MNKREAFKALAEGKKVRPVGVIPNDCYCGYYVLDTYGNIDDDESGCNWDDDNSSNWEIYEPPKNKVKKKVKAFIVCPPDGNLFKRVGSISLHEKREYGEANVHPEFYKDIKEIEFEIIIDE